jgi:hypothetical protein
VLWSVDAQRVSLACMTALLWRVHAENCVLAVRDKGKLGQAPQPAHLSMMRQVLKVGMVQNGPKSA